MEISAGGNSAVVEGFAALADPFRLRILDRLRKSDATISTLSDELGMAAPSVSKHVSVLSRAGFVIKHVEAQRRRCSLAPEGFARLGEWSKDYEALWSDRLARLEVMLDEIEDPRC